MVSVRVKSGRVARGRSKLWPTKARSVGKQAAAASAVVFGALRELRPLATAAAAAAVAALLSTGRVLQPRAAVGLVA